MDHISTESIAALQKNIEERRGLPQCSCGKTVSWDSWAIKAVSLILVGTDPKKSLDADNQEVAVILICQHCSEMKLFHLDVLFPEPEDSSVD